MQMSKHERKRMKREERERRRIENERKSDTRKTLMSGVVIFLVALAALFLLGKLFTKQSGVLDVTPEIMDLGIVPRAEGVKTADFMVRNTGDGGLEINGMVTSCMCTQVSLIKDGKESPKFGMAGHGTNPIGWSEVLEGGETATLKVYYDPNVHAGLTGPVRRGITIFSSTGKKDVMIKLMQT